MPTDRTLFPDFPDAARVWIYVADRTLGKAETDRLVAGLEPFLASWTSHRRTVRGAATVLDDRFLVLAATAPDGDLSGCGIDKSVHRVEALGGAIGVGWVSALEVCWRAADGTVRVAPRSEFRRAVSDGHADASTRVFDPSVETLGDVREGRFEVPAAESWHGHVFGIGAAGSRA